LIALALAAAFPAFASPGWEGRGRFGPAHTRVGWRMFPWRRHRSLALPAASPWSRLLDPRGSLCRGDLPRISPFCMHGLNFWGARVRCWSADGGRATSPADSCWHRATLNAQQPRVSPKGGRQRQAKRRSDTAAEAEGPRSQQGEEAARGGRRRAESAGAGCAARQARDP
jgi:hypothetical protein